jgi:hypothetical protein
MIQFEMSGHQDTAGPTDVRRPGWSCQSAFLWEIDVDEYFLVVRRYAPFATFGGGFEGDSRTEASTLPTATARTVGTVMFTPTDVQGYIGFSDGSTFEGAGAWLAEKIGRRYSKVKAEVSGISILPQSLSFVVHTSGANPLVPIVAPAIDTYIDFKASFGRGGNTYAGTVRGDNFPNAEVFVVEPSGRQVLLFDFRTAGGKNTGPFTRLFGGHASQVLGTFDVTAVSIGPLLQVGATKGT